ncbi:MAG: RpiB/LacA/LacB family sugar-phosphate isomerase, partial [Planctomycetaceae bacterium]|nr:RpiB/LacA/LacB family sugar-phosphate isomerase [Planctomycetaceae bacterium]
MKIAVASDHRGVRVRGQIVQQIKEMQHEVVDFGPTDSSSVDYPDFARKVALAVANGEVDRGILICGTGMGMCIAANKFRGIRAVTCHDDVTAEYSRRHNDANIMCLSADMLG